MSATKIVDPVTVTIGMLRRAELFAPGSSRRCGFAMADLTVVVLFIVEPNKLKFIWGTVDNHRSQIVDVVGVDTGVGTSLYFLCPEEHLRCAELVLTDEQFLSWQAREKRGLRAAPQGAGRHPVLRKLERLLGRDGRGPARGRNRVKLLDAIELEPWVWLIDPQIAATLDKEFARLARERARPARSSRRATAPSPGNGLADGVEVEITDDQRDWARLLATAATTRRVRVRDLALAMVEDYPALSVDAMLAAGMLVPGAARARTFELAGAGACVVECHLERPGLAFAFINLAGDATGQIIGLDYNGGCKRWTMLCPLSGARSRMLYLRDGVFGSRATNRLVHQSQRKARPA